MARGGRVTLQRKPQKLPVWFKLLLVSVGLASASLLVTAVVGRDGLLDLQRQQERHQRLRLDVLEKQDRIDRLEAKARAGQGDQPLLEKIAREELDLVGDGEIVYRIHDEQSPPPPPADPVD
jgi:cell division protein FtsB